MNAIRVIPRMERNYAGKLDAVLFLPDGDERPGYITSYSHIGQHSTVSIEYYQMTRQPRGAEQLRAVQNLLVEYENLGGRTPLRVLKRMPSWRSLRRG